MYYNLGIDIDGVLTDEGTAENNIWQRKMNEYFSRDIKLGKYTYNLAEAYGLSEAELNDFLKNKLFEVYQQVNSAPGARETLSELAEQGHKLFLITARHENFRDLTEDWLEQHQIPYHELHHQHDKAPLVLQKNISLFVDDKKENAINIAAENIPVILVSKYHNSDFKGNQIITKVDNWEQIKENIDLFLSKNTPTSKLS
ncbi:hypothetical protein LJ207_05720 [Halanaerobium sp. Z-7514]|uniref:Nucleotidase n=1 Tax=Halanaerobium polyolivorans TaxID=2886943 RepID=A0AAW4X041_9FIRM|nr:hypothetical protein [Halanaerobium polyolivorans]MCC3144826.1 hypothetical protein [Halanaerobium polyolivorans]